MKCPNCKSDELYYFCNVIEQRLVNDWPDSEGYVDLGCLIESWNNDVESFYECQSCGQHYTIEEAIEQGKKMPIVKDDGILSVNGDLLDKMLAHAKYDYECVSVLNLGCESGLIDLADLIRLEQKYGVKVRRKE